MKRLLRPVLALALLAALVLLSACGAAQPVAESHADLAALYEQLKALPDAPEMLPVSEKRIQTYYGIDPAACRQLMLANCADGLRVDEIWLVECESEEAAKELVSRAEARIQQLCDETENYLPDQYAIAREGRTARVGSTMALFISPQADTMAELFLASFK